MKRAGDSFITRYSISIGVVMGFFGAMIGQRLFGGDKATYLAIGIGLALARGIDELRQQRV